MPKRRDQTNTHESQRDNSISSTAKDTSEREVDEASRKRRRTPSPPQDERNKRHRRDTASPPAVDMLRITKVNPLDTPCLSKLNRWCERKGMSKPILSSEIIRGSGRGRLFRVWLILETNQYELPNFYLTTEEGFERLAEQVLIRLENEYKNGSS